jgi:uncharacterized protein with WD repeat
MTGAKWDCSSKYIVTSSVMTKSYQIWTAYGEQIHKDTIVGVTPLDSVIWRPRPQHLLSEKEERDIEKNFKDLKKK